MDKEYLKTIWNSVLKEGLTEIETQKLYYQKLKKKLKGKDRSYINEVKRKIDQLAIENSFTKIVLSEIKNTENNNHQSLKFEPNFRKDGDGTEWIVEMDKQGNVYKRKLGSDEKILVKPSDGIESEIGKKIEQPKNPPA